MLGKFDRMKNVGHLDDEVIGTSPLLRIIDIK